MKRLFALVIATILILIMAVGCTQTPAATQDEQTVEDTAEQMSDEQAEAEGENPSMDDETAQVAVGEETAVGYIDVTPEEAKDLTDANPDIIIIDVSPKYAAGHLPGAVNYPVGDGSLDDAIPTLDMSKTYLVYCHADGPSISGATKLIEAGFEDVYRLIGNYAAWTAAGYPVEK